MTDSPHPLADLTEALRAAGVPFPADLERPSEPVDGATHRSFALTVRDGVRLAVDLHLPPLAPGQTVPTCLRSTRYWRATAGNPVAEHVQALEAQRWTRAGFALVLLDHRGTGASTGTWDRGWDDAQRADLVELLDWICAQGWSDGTVGGYGTSYDGTTAHLLAATGHPAVRAVVPRFGLHDAYAHIGAPGGVPLDGFVQTWASLNWTLDGHPERATCPLPLPVTGGPRPLDEDTDGSLLAAARAEHAGNWDLWGTVRDAHHRLEEGGPDMGQGTPLANIAALRKARVPMWLWSSWYDGAYAAAQLAELADPELDVRVTLGPFSHGAAYPPLGDPLRPDATNVPFPQQIMEIQGFLRHHLSGVGPDPSPARLRYYRLGDGWREADAWPPPGSRLVRHALGSSGALGGEPDDGARSYDVDFEVTSGEGATRWHTLLGGVPVHYPDRRTVDERLLVWEGEPLLAPLGLTGTPVAWLELVSDAPDFAVHLYLETVLPDGTVTYLTEGELRASHRALGAGPPAYEVHGPWRTHSAADASPVTPGEPATLAFALWPISVLLPAGARLRVALAGADAGNFRRIPEDGSAVRWRVSGRSWVDLPLEQG